MEVLASAASPRLPFLTPSEKKVLGAIQELARESREFYHYCGVVNNFTQDYGIDSILDQLPRRFKVCEVLTGLDSLTEKGYLRKAYGYRWYLLDMPEQEPESELPRIGDLKF